MATAIVNIISDDRTRAVIALLMVVGTFALLLLQRPIPDFVIGLDGLAVGFYFGGTVERASKGC